MVDTVRLYGRKNMQIETVPLELSLDQIDSDADYVLLTSWRGILSEHCTLGEARMAYFQAASRQQLGAQLPCIYVRREDSWAPLN
jgi:hypothetical protein